MYKEESEKDELWEKTIKQDRLKNCFIAISCDLSKAFFKCYEEYLVFVIRGSA